MKAVCLYWSLSLFFLTKCMLCVCTTILNELFSHMYNPRRMDYLTFPLGFPFHPEVHMVDCPWCKWWLPESSAVECATYVGMLVFWLVLEIPLTILCEIFFFWSEKKIMLTNSKTSDPNPQIVSSLTRLEHRLLVEMDRVFSPLGKIISLYKFSKRTTNEGTEPLPQGR